MSIGIWRDEEKRIGGLYCNTDEIAFGPVFGAEEDPQDFLDWYEDSTKASRYIDVRRLTATYLTHLVDEWRKEVEENENEEKGMRTLAEPGAWTGGFAKNA